jgi:chromosome segregation ATPase
MDKEIEDRIFAAANALYEECGRQSFPKVDVVRKAARANMNDVSTAMKKWRDLQKIQPAPAALIQVPQAIEDASRALLGSLWQSAQELSNNALRAAQAGWDAERLEAAAMSKEMADGYEAKALEVETAQGEIAQLHASVATSASSLAQLQSELDAMRRALADAKAAAEQSAQVVSTQHAGEVAQLHAAVEAERARRREEVELIRAELHEQHQKAATERDQSRSELAKVKAEAATAEQQRAMAYERQVTAEAERGDSVKEAAVAREDAAQLRGQVEVMQKQTTELLAIIERWQVPMAGDKAAPDQAGQAPAAASIPIDFDPSIAMPKA